MRVQVPTVEYPMSGEVVRQGNPSEPDGFRVGVCIFTKPSREVCGYPVSFVRFEGRNGVTPVPSQTLELIVEENPSERSG